MIPLNVITVVGLAVGSLNVSNHPLDGVWQSQGWGFVHQIRGATLQVLEVTRTTCVKGFKAQQRRLNSSIF
jgi:hypothetical protein